MSWLFLKFPVLAFLFILLFLISIIVAASPPFHATLGEGYSNSGHTYPQFGCFRIPKTHAT
jgi:hypothetical protein